MQPRIGLLGITLSICLIGCATSVPAEQGDNLLLGKQQSPSSDVSVSSTNVGQMLPISALADIGGQRINLEVAWTPQQQAMGLMYRTDLADDRGMLFPFEPPRPVSFWMKNTLIPLDMIFLRNGQVKAIETNVPPCTTTPCPNYGPDTVVIDQVIELRGGRAAELGLKVGDQVNIRFLDGKATSTTP